MGGCCFPRKEELAFTLLTSGLRSNGPLKLHLTGFETYWGKEEAGGLFPCRVKVVSGRPGQRQAGMGRGGVGVQKGQRVQSQRPPACLSGWVRGGAVAPGKVGANSGSQAGFPWGAVSSYCRPSPAPDVTGMGTPPRPARLKASQTKLLSCPQWVPPQKMLWTLASPGPTGLQCVPSWGERGRPATHM